ncbi:MAG: DUF1778 domain-containing protein, partial [Burkholderiales bacterium]|nr:DUF1778 domain-containing protein [Burkholderiales bacterium]
MADTKSAQLQLRISPAEKEKIRRAARRAGLEISGYVLARVLPVAAQRFQDLTTACGRREGERFALAELSAWLATLG